MGEWDQYGGGRAVKMAETDRDNWKNGDWLCPNEVCRNHNFSANDRCRLCKFRKAGNSEFVSCKFFQGSGGCQFGESCRYQHITVDEYLREQFGIRSRGEGKGVRAGSVGVRAGSVERRTGGAKGSGGSKGRPMKGGKRVDWDEDESDEDDDWDDPREPRKGRGKRARSVERPRSIHRTASLVARTGTKGKGKLSASEAAEERAATVQAHETGEECGSLLEEMLDEFMEELNSTCKKWRKSLGERIRGEIRAAKQASTASSSGAVKEETQVGEKVIVDAE